jgi:multiple sugar transport system substrate-binding protein
MIQMVARKPVNLIQYLFVRVGLTTSNRKKRNSMLITTGGSGIDPTRRSTLTSPRGFAPKVQRAAESALSGNGAISWPTNDKSAELMEKLSDQLSPDAAGP